MDSDARDDSAAGDAADSPSNDRRFVIPTARSLPDREEPSDGGEEMSPSQYKLSRMREESHISDGSDGGSSDEEVEIAEEEFSPDEYDHEVEVAPRAVLSKKAALKVDCDALMQNLLMQCPSSCKPSCAFNCSTRERKDRKTTMMRSVIQARPLSLIAHELRNLLVLRLARSSASLFRQLPIQTMTIWNLWHRKLLQLAKKCSPHFVLWIRRTRPNVTMPRFASGCNHMLLNK
jgi:hypothetical protein